jgi:hypothetical protein
MAAAESPSGDAAAPPRRDLLDSFTQAMDSVAEVIAGPDLPAALGGARGGSSGSLQSQEGRADGADGGQPASAAAAPGGQDDAAAAAEHVEDDPFDWEKVRVWLVPTRAG